MTLEKEFEEVFGFDPEKKRDEGAVRRTLHLLEAAMLPKKVPRHEDHPTPADPEAPDKYAEAQRLARNFGYEAGEEVKQ